MSEASAACSRCAATGSSTCGGCGRGVCEGHGAPTWPTWIDRHLFGPFLFRAGERVCPACRSRRIWRTWQLFALGVGLVVAVAGVANGHAGAALVAVPVALAWYGLAGRMARREGG